jgi:hypothetical protein
MHLHRLHTFAKQKMHLHNFAHVLQSEKYICSKRNCIAYRPAHGCGYTKGNEESSQNLFG